MCTLLIQYLSVRGDMMVLLAPFPLVSCVALRLQPSIHKTGDFPVRMVTTVSVNHSGWGAWANTSTVLLIAALRMSRSSIMTIVDYLNGSASSFTDRLKNHLTVLAEKHSQDLSLEKNNTKPNTSSGCMPSRAELHWGTSSGGYLAQ